MVTVSGLFDINDKMLEDFILIPIGTLSHKSERYIIGLAHAINTNLGGEAK